MRNRALDLQRSIDALRTGKPAQVGGRARAWEDSGPASLLWPPGARCACKLPTGSPALLTCSVPPTIIR